jgi:hypothetical protein
MITNAILSFVLLLINGLLALLPQGGTFPASVTNAVENLGKTMHALDFIFPINSFMAAFIFLVSVQIAIFAVWSIIIIMRFVRG